MTETPDEWINKLFEFNFCDVCGGDVEDHEVCLVPGFGTYFARCIMPSQAETDDDPGNTGGRTSPLDVRGRPRRDGSTPPEGA